MSELFGVLQETDGQTHECARGQIRVESVDLLVSFVTTLTQSRTA